MAQTIKNIKKGQRFIVQLDTLIRGFDVGCIIEATENVDNCSENRYVMSKWIGGYMPWYVKSNPKINLKNMISELKRFKGKIK